MRIICTIIAAVFSASFAQAGVKEALVDSFGAGRLEDQTTVWVVALNEGGYVMALSGMEYNPEQYQIWLEHGKLGSWSTYGTGEPLNLIHNGPFSNDEVDPLNPGSCPVDVDPLAAAAVQNSETALKYEQTPQCPYPMHPSGELFAAKLPGGATAFLRLASGTVPAESGAVFRGEVYPFKPITNWDFARLIVTGEASEMDGEMSLESQVAWSDCVSLVAYIDEVGQVEAQEQARLTVNNIIAKFVERHGREPVSLDELTSLPGAVIARLPWSPYDPSGTVEME